MWSYPEPLEGTVDTRGYVSFYWNKMDAWFEEGEEAFVHAKDPYKRVDCFRSDRHVKVVLNGETIAETNRPVLLLETGLPHRFYIPETDVRREVLRPSDTVTRCPYKGEAHYYTVAVGGEQSDDLAWYYRYPTPEAAKVANHICFPQGKVEMYVDGELEPKPRSRWD